MLGFVRRRLLRLSSCKANSFAGSVALSDDPASNSFFSSEAARAPSDDKDVDFMKSYLINSYGLSPDAANLVSKKINFKSADKPDAVLKCLRLLGFRGTQIASVVQRRPDVLLAKPEKTLIPKIQLLATLGASPADVAKIIDGFPAILHLSLERRLAPSLLCLKSLLHTDENVVQVLLQNARLFKYDAEASLVPNVAVLRELGMPDNVISMCLKYRPHVLIQLSDPFKKVVERAEGMGFDPKKYVFVEAMSAIFLHSEEKWEQKCEVFRKWGWSDIEFLNAFKKTPQVITYSERKIDEVMNLMVNTMGFSPSAVAKCPRIIMRSARRMRAQFHVIQILEAKGMIKRDDYKISWLTIGEPLFLKRFVTKRKDILPELLDVYYQVLEDGKPVLYQQN